MKHDFLKFRHRIWYNFLFVLLHFLGTRIHVWITKFKKTILIDLEQRQDDLNKKTSNIFPKNTGFLKGAAKDWAATNKWSFDYFKKVYGEREVFLIDTKGVIDPKAPQKAERIKLSHYIEELQKGSLKYLKLSNLTQKEVSLQEDLNLPWLRSLKNRFSFGEVFYTFIGGKNTVTPLHNEFPMTVYIQLVGKKKWTIFPPHDDVFLDVTTERRTYFFSKYAPGKNDAAYPLAKYAKKFEVVLEPGDIIIVPPFYWHYVENMTDSIGVAYKYANIFNGLKSSKLLTFLFLLSTKPSIFYSFFASRIQKDDYVLREKKD